MNTTFQGRKRCGRTTRRLHATILWNIFRVEWQEIILDRWKCAYNFNWNNGSDLWNHFVHSMREHTSLVSRILLMLTGFFNYMNLDIANYIYEHPMALDLSLQGIWINDRKPSSPSMHKFTYKVKHVTASISWDVVQEQIPAVDFVHKYENVFSFKFVHSSHFPPTLSILIHLLMAVNHSWPNLTKKQHRATTQATWTNISHILQTDSFHFLESQRRRILGVIYGTRFSMRHWLWTLRSTFIVYSIRRVLICGSCYLV